jgi:hypothetical protein
VAAQANGGSKRLRPLKKIGVKADSLKGGASAAFDVGSSVLDLRCLLLSCTQNIEHRTPNLQAEGISG